MTCACTLETNCNKLDKKSAVLFFKLSVSAVSSTQSFLSSSVVTTKRCKIFLTFGVIFGVNIITIRGFYDFISSHLQLVVEAGEDGGEFKLSNTMNVCFCKMQGVRRTYFRNKDWQTSFFFKKSSLVKGYVGQFQKSSRLITASLFIVYFTIYTAGC